MSDQSEEDLTEVEDDPSRSRDIELACENCGAQVTWDPEADALSCAHCGHEETVPRGEGTIEERPLSAAGDAARGLGVEVRVAQCETCGARVAFDKKSTATECVFCGSPSVLAQEANRNALRPESLIPLDVGREEVERRFRKWIKGLWFRPNALKKTKDFRAVGVYIPAWTFDCAVHSDWSADAGYYYWVTESYTTRVNGKTVRRTRQVRKIRWRPAWGERDDAYDDLQILASHGVAPGLAAELGPFDTAELVPYKPEYLAGWRAEEYQVDLETGWGMGKHAVAESQRARCAGDIPGDTHRRLEVRNRVRDVRWKHVLLPMWSLTYQYGGKGYAVLIHGQSGRIAGKAPLSWFKILGLVLLIVALVLIVLAVGAAS